MFSLLDVVIVGVISAIIGAAWSESRQRPRDRRLELPPRRRARPN